MTFHLFAGVAVSDYTRAVQWYERLLGRPATFEAHATESVWDLAERRSMYVVERPADAGHALVTLFYDDPGELDTLLRDAAGRDVHPELDETYGNGVRKVTFRDPDGNEVGFGTMPQS